MALFVLVKKTNIICDGNRSAASFLGGAFPVEAALPELKKRLGHGVGAILVAPPGAGKTTVVPLALLEEAWMVGKKIILLEPRRLAARAAAYRMSDMLGEPVGNTVGYRVRMDSKVGPRTRVEAVTEGILTRRIQNDPELEDVGLVVFDEFHERSIHADTGLALCLDVRSALRPDLRILVMSATLDTESLQGPLNDIPVVAAEGKIHPVDTVYASKDLGFPVASGVAEAVSTSLRETSGDILVFLPGAGEIRQVQQRLAEKKPGNNVGVVPLYGLLPKRAQDEAIRPSPEGARKVVLATSIAETSLTIEGVRAVVDSGFSRVPRFDVGSGMTRLETIRVTRDSADQRRGRAGRTGPGVCYRLYTEQTLRGSPLRRRPEILNADLAPLALELAHWGASDPRELSWVDPPPEAAYAEARKLLFQLGAVDENGRITPHGKEMCRAGLHPRLSHMVLEAKAMGEGELACRLAAFLERRDFILQGAGPRDSDIRTRMEILEAVLNDRPSAGVGVSFDHAACRAMRKEIAHFKRQFAIRSEPVDIARTGVLLAMAYPDRIGMKRPGSDRRYLLSNGRGACFPDIEPLCAEELIVAPHLDGAETETSIFLAAPLSIRDLERHFPHRFERTRSVRFDDATRGVSALERVRFGALTVDEKKIPNPGQQEVARALLEGIRRNGIRTLPWDKKLENWMARVAFLGRVFGQEETSSAPAWPDMSDEALLDSLEDWLLPFIAGVGRLDRIKPPDLKAALENMLTWKQKKDLERLAPSHFTVPSGSRIPVDYKSGEQPVLAVRLQEMFGLAQHPTVADGKSKLLLHLLSPAHRPVQITGDLAGFWKKTYHDVKKDLKGRYPKHPWPEDPANAEPTSRRKKTG